VDSGARAPNGTTRTPGDSPSEAHYPAPPVALIDRYDALAVDDELRSILDRIPNKVNEYGYDAWGMNPETAIRTAAATRWLYRTWFRAEAHGIEHVPAGRVLLIANHGGQFPFDGIVIGTACLLEADPPRVVRAMVERWVPNLPFVSTLFQRLGQIVGNRDDCRKLLENDEAVLVFPEGVRGSGKTIWKRYQLQRFGLGFMRLAMETNTPIVPVGVVGSEESIPSVADLKTLARAVGAPYLPVPATLPLLGPLAFAPLPTKFILNFGEPMRFTGRADATDAQVADRVEQVKEALAALIEKGRGERAGVFAK